MVMKKRALKKRVVKMNEWGVFALTFSWYGIGLINGSASDGMLPSVMGMVFTIVGMGFLLGFVRSQR